MADVEAVEDKREESPSPVQKQQTPTQQQGQENDRSNGSNNFDTSQQQSPGDPADGVESQSDNESNNNKSPKKEPSVPNEESKSQETGKPTPVNSTDTVVVTEQIKKAAAADAHREVAMATAASHVPGSSTKKGKGQKNQIATEKPVSKGPLWVQPNPKTEEELKKAIENIRGHPNLPNPPIPVVPKFDSRVSIKSRVRKVQEYISSFEYNHTGTRYFPVHKDKGQIKLTDTAQQIMREALPIQCLEAVMLGCFLTTKWQGVDRVPISFKSFVKPINKNFRHIVMAVRYQGKWGAIGLSRKETLMYKPVKFPTLASLIKDYQEAYDKCWHVLKKVYIGFPFRHEPHSAAPIKWRVLNLRVDKHPWEEVAESLNAYSRDLKKLTAYYHLHKRLPDSFASTYVFKKALKVVVSRSPKTGSNANTPKSQRGTPRNGRLSKLKARTSAHKKLDANNPNLSSPARAALMHGLDHDPNASSDEDESSQANPGQDDASNGDPLEEEKDVETNDGEKEKGNEEDRLADAPNVSNTQINQAFLAV